MRKILLSLVAMVLGVASMVADQYTVTFKTGTNTQNLINKTGIGVDSVVESGVAYIGSFTNVTNTYGCTAGGMRVGQNKAAGAVDIVLAGDGVVSNATSIVLKACGGKNASSAPDVTVNGTKISIPKSANATPAETDWKEYTYEVSGALNTITISSTYMVNIASITVNYSNGGGPVAPSAPTITGAATFWGETTPITISAAAGCDIYYTVDGNDPTTSSLKYTDSFDIATTTTVKAIAVREGLLSPVATATFTKGTPVNVASVKEFLEKSKDEVCKFTSPLTVVYQYKGYLFVKDATGGMQFFTGSINTEFPGTYQMGQTLTGVVAKRDVYQNNPQGAVKDFLSTFPTEASGSYEQIDPLVITADKVAEHLNEYVCVGDVNITKTGSNYYVGTAQLYNRFGKDALTDALLEGKYDVAGFAVVYNTTPEIYYTEIANTGVITGIENVENEACDIYGSEGCVVAPEGAKVYNLYGVATGKNMLPAGMYIVVMGEKVKKVIVK